jgi:outer membrane protein TolC
MINTSMKKVSSRPVLFILMALLPVASLKAQMAGKITLSDAVQIALKNNLGMQIATNNVTIAGVNNDYGVAGGLPYINASAGNQETAGSLRQTFANDSLNKSTNNAFSNSTTASLSGNILLFNGWRVNNTKRRLATVERQSRQQLSSRALILINNVMLKYYDIVRQQSYARTLKQSIDVSRQRLDIVRAQQNVGVANNADLFQSQVDLNTAVQNLQAQQLIVDQGKTDLLTLMTLNPDSAIAVEDTIVVDSTLRLGPILDAVQSANPDVLVADEQITIARFLVKEIGAQRYPSLYFNGGYNLVRSQNSNVNKVTPLMNLSYGPYVGITLNLPLFNGGVFKKQQEVADINAKNFQLQKDTLILNYTSNAVKNWQAYNSNLSQLQTAKANYDLSQKLLDLVLQRFQLRQATIVDVKNAQQSFENAGYILINVSFAAKSAEVQLRRYANQLVP